MDVAAHATEYENDQHQDNPERPRTRADCQDAPRPCPWIGCRYHLLTDVNERGSLVFSLGKPGQQGRRAIRLRTPDWRRERIEEQALDQLAHMSETCALDVADVGAKTLREVGDLLGVTQEAVRLIEMRAKAKGKSAK